MEREGDPGEAASRLAVISPHDRWVIREERQERAPLQLRMTAGELPSASHQEAKLEGQRGRDLRGEGEILFTGSVLQATG